MSKKGFTLIELLIVVAIIAILAMIAVPNFLEAQVRSKVSRTKADMRSVATGLEAYDVDNNAYPPEWEYSAPGNGYTEPPFHSRISSWITTPIAYLTSIPLDPFITQKHAYWLNWAPESLNKRYIYYNYPWMLNLPGATITLRNRANDAGAWLFYSFGPDKVWDCPPGSASGVYTNYDPSNGTVSWGNVFRTQKTNDLYVRGNW